MRLPRKYKLAPDLSLPTIADMAMLLLIFFVVCGKISAKSKISVVPPKSLTAEKMPRGEQTIITVDAEGSMFLNGRPIAEPELRDEIQALLSQQNSRAERTVYIETDRRTPFRAYVIAVDAVNMAKGYVELKVKK